MTSRMSSLSGASWQYLSLLSSLLSAGMIGSQKVSSWFTKDVVNTVPLNREICSQLSLRDIWPAEPFAVPVFEARQYLVVREVLQGLTIIQQEATRKVLVVIRFGRAS